MDKNSFYRRPVYHIPAEYKSMKITQSRTYVPITNMPEVFSQMGMTAVDVERSLNALVDRYQSVFEEQERLEEQAIIQSVFPEEEWEATFALVEEIKGVLEGRV